MTAASGPSMATLDQWIGKELGVSSWVTLDQSRIDRFADCTGDHQWIHVDGERARRESPFGTTIAHGFLTLSLLATFFDELLITPAGIRQAVNYGLDKVRFLAPVRAGGRVRGRIVLKAVDAKAGGALLLTLETVVEIEGEGKPALSAVGLVMIFPG
jgi:acyl dehydratase